jgi:hypothetical protein
VADDQEAQAADKETSVEPEAPDLGEIQQMLAALPVESVIASSASTLHGIAAAKLERGDLAQAQKAIDALAALVGQLEGEIGREIRLSLAQLQVAFAAAAANP